MSNFVPVTPEKFASKTWKEPENFSFARKDSIVQIHVAEVLQVMFRLPLGWILSDNKFILVGFQSLEPLDNLLVSPSGKWIGKYLPDIYKNYPFRLGKYELEGSENHVVCFDEECGLLMDEDSSTGNDADSSNDFFDPNGDASAKLQEVASSLKKFRQQESETLQVSALLAEMNLLVPWSLKDDVNLEKVITGIYKIDSDAFAKLSPQNLAKLRDSNGLAIIFAHFFSLRHIEGLVNLTLKNRMSGESKEIGFTPIDESGSLSFDHL